MLFQLARVDPGLFVHQSGHSSRLLKTLVGLAHLQWLTDSLKLKVLVILASE